ncbi:DUF4148 domain-containing protein [Paraburkholderia sp. EG287A]|uniref:DUF4148 domain-containing protein n=1 Tax=unclassified Paraburkholderia TaxID=2615204 RepID=UPI0034D26EA1
MSTSSRLALGFLLVTCSVAPALAQVSSQTSDPSAPKTRAEVVAELNEWVAAGYNPDDWYRYPENAEAAEQIVAQRHTGASTAQ